MQKLLTLGFLIILVGFALLVAGAASEGSASAGGVIFIGPFPIVFGSGPFGGDLALLSVVIGGIMIALVAIWAWRFYSTGRN